MPGQSFPVRGVLLAALLPLSVWFVSSGLAQGDEKPLKKETTNSIGMNLVLIPAGKFTMGSPRGELGRNPNELQHEVEITRPFYMGVYEVTQKQYREVMGKNPSDHSKEGIARGGVKGLDTDNFPVTKVSWKDCWDFCEKLAARAGEKKLGLQYRLPTEAEWEYACRGGARTSTPYHFGNSISNRLANHGMNVKRPCKVGSYRPNGFGLYDMHGNVAEWCSDWYVSAYYLKSPQRDPQGPAGTFVNRVYRGGSYISGDWDCRSARRGGDWPELRNNLVGFRVVAVPAKLGGVVPVIPLKPAAVLAELDNPFSALREADEKRGVNKKDKANMLDQANKTLEKTQAALTGKTIRGEIQVISVTKDEGTEKDKAMYTVEASIGRYCFFRCPVPESGFVSTLKLDQTVWVEGIIQEFEAKDAKDAGKGGKLKPIPMGGKLHYIVLKDCSISPRKIRKRR